MISLMISNDLQQDSRKGHQILRKTDKNSRSGEQISGNPINPKGCIVLPPPPLGFIGLKICSPFMKNVLKLNLI